MDNYIVSARKYRPSTFRSVVGQKALTQTLKNAIDSNKLAHAYLRRYPHLVDERAYIVHRVVRGGIELDDVVGALFVEGSARFAFVAGFSRFGRVEAVDCFSENTGTRFCRDAKCTTSNGLPLPT